MRCFREGTPRVARATGLGAFGTTRGVYHVIGRVSPLFAGPVTAIVPAMALRTTLGLLLALLTVPAWAAPPVDKGTRLLPESDDGPAVTTTEGATQRPDTPTEGISVGARGRYVSFPNWILDGFFQEHGSIDTYSIGAEVGIDGPAGSRVIFGLDYTSGRLPAQNWRTVGDRPDQASYTEVNLHLIALDAVFQWKLKFSESVGLLYAVGLGIGYAPGTVASVDVVPNCAPPVNKCDHLRNVTRREQDLSSWRVIPILDLQVGLYWNPHPRFRMRIEGGLHTVPFVGMAAEGFF